MAKKENAKAPSKTEIVTNISESTGLSKKDVSAVFDSLNAQIKNSVGKKGPGMFALPGMWPSRRARSCVRRCVSSSAWSRLPMSSAGSGSRDGRASAT